MSAARPATITRTAADSDIRPTAAAGPATASWPAAAAGPLLRAVAR